MKLDERGQVLPLVLGLSLVTLVIVGLAVDGTRAFLHRRTLQNAADAAALAAAGEVDPAAYYGSGGSRIALEPRRARKLALGWLAARGVQADTQIEAGADEVRIRLRSESATTFLRLIGVDSVAVAVEARAGPVGGTTP